MKTILNFDLLLPVGLIILQAYLFLFIYMVILKRAKILKLPYAGMEYSQVILAASLLFAVFLISTGDLQGIFQAFKTFQNQRQNIFSNTFSRFSQFFLVILFFEILFAIIAFTIIKLLFRFKSSQKEITEGNIPASLLMGVIIIGFSIVFQFCAREIVEYMTPQYLNFR